MMMQDNATLQSIELLETVCDFQNFIRVGAVKIRIHDLSASHRVSVKTYLWDCRLEETVETGKQGKGAVRPCNAIMGMPKALFMRLCTSQQSRWHLKLSTFINEARRMISYKG